MGRLRLDAGHENSAPTPAGRESVRVRFQAVGARFMELLQLGSPRDLGLLHWPMWCACELDLHNWHIWDVPLPEGYLLDRLPVLCRGASGVCRWLARVVQGYSHALDRHEMMRAPPMGICGRVLIAACPITRSVWQAWRVIARVVPVWLGQGRCAAYARGCSVSLA